MSCKEFPKSSVSKFGEALPCIQSHVWPFGCYLLTLWRTFPRLPHHSVYLQLTNFVSLRILSGNVHAVHEEQSERINRHRVVLKPQESTWNARLLREQPPSGWRLIFTHPEHDMLEYLLQSCLKNLCKPPSSVHEQNEVLPLCSVIKASLAT